ncbi:unnamed protein product, partial [Ectocarpus sp. 8 AP-2014]
MFVCTHQLLLRGRMPHTAASAVLACAEGHGSPVDECSITAHFLLFLSNKSSGERLWCGQCHWCMTTPHRSRSYQSSVSVCYMAKSKSSAPTWGFVSGTMSNKAESDEFVGAQIWTLRRTG